MAARGVTAPLTSSAGRLFDAAAALLGVRDTINYEGQAAIELEQLADPAETAAAYPAAVVAGDPFQILGADLLTALVSDLTAGVRAPVIAARFHHGVAAAIGRLRAAARAPRPGHGRPVRRRVPEHAAAARHAARLEARGFRVLTHSRVPCNDGGISLGQAVIAAARDRLAPGAPNAVLE